MAPSDRILIIEDEAEIRELIAIHLRREGLATDAVGSVEEAELLFAQNCYSVMTVDWMLPGVSGVDFTRRVRKNPAQADVGILMLTARVESSNIVEGLEAGADDYLTKPFEPRVLVARVRALLRRQRRDIASELGSNAVIRHGDLELHPETFEVKVSGEKVDLTYSEFKLLLALIENRGRVLTREGLIRHVQGDGVSVVGRTVDTHVFGLRKKLGACADLIETVRGVGYRVIPPFESMPSQTN